MEAVSVKSDNEEPIADVVDRTASIAVESKELLNTEYPGFVEKYFSRHYCNNVKGTEDDYCVLVRGCKSLVM